jgi:hypothetical protein
MTTTLEYRRVTEQLCATCYAGNHLDCDGPAGINNNQNFSLGEIADTTEQASAPAASPLHWTRRRSRRLVTRQQESAHRA